MAVGSIFDNIIIDGDHGGAINVPMYYSAKEKFIDNRQHNPDIETTAFDIVYPAIGFEVQSLNYAPERHLNPLQRIQDKNAVNDDLVSFNRVPYDITFGVYVGARRFEESLRIVEQILPFFQPEITLTIKDREDFDLNTNLTVVLNSVSLDMPYEGSYDQRRTILWQLQLTAKTHYYTPVQFSERIKQTVVNMRDADFNRKFESYQHTVNPRTAKKTEPHTVDFEILPGD